MAINESFSHVVLLVLLDSRAESGGIVLIYEPVAYINSIVPNRLLLNQSIYEQHIVKKYILNKSLGATNKIPL